MKELIKHILREETKDYRSGILDIINKKGLFAGAKIVGGLKNLKKIFHNNAELVSRIENQRGEVYIPLYGWNEELDKTLLNSITLPFYIVGIHNNIWNTNSWGNINVVYDETLLTDGENKLFKEFLTDEFIHEGSPTIRFNMSKEIKDLYYVTLVEINGKPINDVLYDLNDDELSKIFDKLKNKSNINENTNSPLNFLKRRINSEDIIKTINDSIKFVNGFRDREEMDGSTFERIVLDATMDDFHSLLSDDGALDFDYDGIHNGLHQLFHDYIMDKYVEYNNENDILMEEITKRKTGERFEDLPKKDQMNVRVVYNFLLANHLILTEILKDYILHVDEDADEIAYMISKRDGRVHIDYSFQDKLIKLIKDEGYRGDLVEMASYIYLDKHLPKEIKFDSNQRLGGGNISIYQH